MTSKMAVTKNKLLLLSAMVFLFSCSKQFNPATLGDELKKNQSAQNDNQTINDVPTTYEQPATEATPTPDTQKPEAVKPEAQKPEATQPVSSQPVSTPPIAIPPEVKPSQNPTSTSVPSTTTVPNKPVVSKPPVVTPTKTEVSKFIQTAFDVMTKEGKNIGTACNLYLQRVLIRAGFPSGDFIANDFDLYAKKYFKSYKAEDFKIDTSRSDKEELKAHLWSYPARTPFILQWTRPGHYGHVAIVERIGEDLIIYQASIGNHTARRDQTTIERLLSSKNRASLTVYSEFR